MEAAYEKLQQELEEQQCLLLVRLRELEQQIWKERDEYISKVLEEVARLGTQVKELEEKCQQPGSELLHVRDTLPPLWDRRGIPQEADPCCGLEDAGERQEREVEIISRERD